MHSKIMHTFVSKCMYMVTETSFNWFQLVLFINLHEILLTICLSAHKSLDVSFWSSSISLSEHCIFSLFQRRLNLFDSVGEWNLLRGKFPDSLHIKTNLRRRLCNRNQPVASSVCVLMHDQYNWQQRSACCHFGVCAGAWSIQTALQYEPHSFPSLNWSEECHFVTEKWTELRITKLRPITRKFK